MSFIPPLTCSNCGHSARPGEEGFGLSDTEVICKCGNRFTDRSSDQRVLSSNVFVRLGALSNHSEHGSAATPIGRARLVTFATPFDFVGRVYLTPIGFPFIAKEYFENSRGMLVLTSRVDGEAPLQEMPTSVQFNWMVYGLRDIDSLPSWQVLFYGATTHAVAGLFKAALLDYAVAFEAYLESFLAKRLTEKYGDALSQYLMRRAWRVEERSKDLLDLATGHRLTERDDVYQPWFEHVKGPRDRLAHGDRLTVGASATELAHSAVFQAIRWIESIA